MASSSLTITAPLSTIATFGEFLKFLRRRAQMTQRELAIAVGYSISQISRLEQNERLPDEITIMAVFVPALGLEKEPALVARLVALAQSAHATAVEPEATPATESSPVFATEEPVAVTSPHHNLPYQLTSFVGRTADCAAISELLITARLLTLTGVGGVGKTRLALAVAHMILGSAQIAAPPIAKSCPVSSCQKLKFPDGVWFVDLAPLHEAALVATTILAAFQLPVLADHAPTALLLSYLKQKQMLLVLDNCEHLVTTCANLVDRILHTCSGVTILATSREALNVDGEVEWPVKPLTTPLLPDPAARPLATAQIHDFEAVRLFRDRAQAIRTEWQLTDQHAPAVAQICTHLDGIPLAIELAAARLKGLTLEEIAAHLDDRFTLLTSGRRTALLRHQTLRAAIDWSYDLLSEPEQHLLRQLAVFTGGWTAAAVSTLTGDRQALPLLLQLVNKSLVVMDETRAEARYTMLETIRQYAMEKLREAGEADQAAQQHFAYFLALAEESWLLTLIGPSLSAWLHQIVLEYDNLRVAFAWGCQQADQGEGALRLAGALGLFWVVRGEFREGIRWLEASLAHDQGHFPVARGMALSRLADLAGMVGQPRLALVEEALALFTTAHQPLGISYCLHLWGATLHASAPVQAIAMLEQGLQLYRDLAYPLGIGIILWKLGDAYSADGEAPRAVACYEECIAIGRQYNERLLMCRPLIMLTVVDRERALQICQAELQRPQPDPETQAALLHTLGRILEDHERFVEAKTTLLEALGLWHKLGIKWSVSGGITRALLDLGLICFCTKDDVASASYMTEAQQLYADVGDWHGVAWTQVILGHLALRQHQCQQALTYFQASLCHSADYRINYSMNYLPLVFCGMAATLVALGKPNIAFHLFGAATCFEDKLFALDVPVQASFVQALAAARECLTDPLLAAAWAEGQAMSVQQAVTYVLAQPVENDVLLPVQTQA